jgi:GGDEF domain-containing protein
MGGDEFVLVLPGLKPPDLLDKTKALETVVVDAGLAVCGERLLNISVGAAFCPEHGVDAEGLLAEADRRMYLVKQTHKCAGSTVAADLAALAVSVGTVEGGDSLSHEDILSPPRSASTEENQLFTDGPADA